MRRRVWVTGMGTVSAAGMNVATLWDAARLGRSAVRALKFSRDVGNLVKIAAQIQDFDEAAYQAAALPPKADRFVHYALIAARQAMEQAGLTDAGPPGASPAAPPATPPAIPLGPRTAVIIGTSLGGAMTLDDQHFRLYVTGKRPGPMVIPRTMSNAAASLISARYGATGPVFAVSSACASASQAIGLGTWMVRAGLVDRAIVGGTEAMITPSIFCAWEALRVLTPDLCRPFSRQRNGMVLGEGAGVFVIEAADHASARGATPLAEIAGYGTTANGQDLVRSNATGAAAAMRAALDDAGLAPAAIDYISAHGTGTIANDAIEAEALALVFGDDLRRVAVSATKPIHGHALGAVGALELAITIMALRAGVAPPTINCEDPDPACPIDMVAGRARALKIRAALTNSFAFGGINAVLLVTAVAPH